MSRDTIGGEPHNAALAECQETVRRVLQSQTFARAEKLQRFLKFVSELTLRGEAALVNEHLIAVDVFGRGDDYSPGEDSVVRRQAHALRRKLKEYYEAEGKGDRIQIEIPVGTYVPSFRDAREKPPGAERPVSATTPAPFRISVWKPLIVVGLALSVTAAVFWAGWRVGRLPRAAHSTPTAAEEGLREIWGPWLSDTSGVAFCFSNPTAATVRQFPGPIRPNPEHQGVAVTRDQDAMFRRFFQFPNDGVIYLYPVLAQAKMGEAIAAVALTAFFSRSGVPVSAIESRFVTLETLRRENVVLLGHADSNQWVEPLLRSAPFTVAATDQEHRARILNRSPQRGEQAEYRPTIPDASKSYALMSMLPGVDGFHKILVVSGLDNSSTAAAAEYLIANNSATALVRLLKDTAPGHRGPWHFQVILETEVRDAVALKASPIAIRVLSPPSARSIGPANRSPNGS